VRHWLRFGADGWRLDVAHMMGAGGIDTNNLEVLRRLKTAARSENPEAWIFGERFWDAEAALQGPNDAFGHDGGGEDGVMNYHGFTLPITDWLSGMTIFDRPVQLATAELVALMQERLRVIPPAIQLSQYNLIGSHDIPRPLTRMGGDLAKLRTAFTLLMTFPGVPGIYYGDEIGLSGGNDPFCRAPFPWDETQWDLETLEHVKGLIQLRRSSLALQRGSLVWLAHTDDSIVYARVFTHEDGREESVIVAATRGAGETIQIDVGRLEGTGWVDAVTRERVESQGDGLLELKVLMNGACIISNNIFFSPKK
jgi:alpha-glucosidase